MNCQSAGELLSGYLDDALDPTEREDVCAHVEQCAACAALLEEYRRFDSLVANLPKLQPADSLRRRIFEDPEIAALMLEVADEPTTRLPAASVADADPTVKAPRVLLPGSSRSASSGSHRHRMPTWARMGLPAAALLGLVIGGGVLTYSIHADNTVARTHQGNTLTIGAPGQTGIPLPAGPRVVYERDGALWSAPETGPGLAHQLTPRGVRVASWQVAPIGDSTTGGQLIAFIDATNGAVHIIRSDGQSDTVIAEAATQAHPSASFWGSTTGQAIRAGLAWSPDGTRLAYVTQTTLGGTMLNVINADGSASSAVSSGVQDNVASAVWNTDGSRLAYVVTNPGPDQGIWIFDRVAGQSTQIATTADPANTGTVASRLAWTASTGGPELTWAAANPDGTFSGVFVQRVANGSTSGSPIASRISPAGTRFDTAAYTSAGGGQWLTSSGGSLYLLSISSGGYQSVGALGSASLRRIVWSPSGEAAALVGSGTIGLWTPTAGVAPVTHAANDAVMPVWSRDGTQLIYATSDALVLMKPLNNGWSAALTELPIASATSLQWAPDGQAVAVNTAANGAELINPVSGSAQTVDPQAASGAAVVWSIAG